MDVQDCLASSMRACTSAPVWQPSNSTSAMSFDSFEPPACSGIAIRTSNSAFNSTVPPLKFFTLTQWLPTVPQAALCVLQVRCRWRFRRALSSSYRCDCWSFCRLPRASSSPVSHSAWPFRRRPQLPLVILTILLACQFGCAPLALSW